MHPPSYLKTLFAYLSGMFDPAYKAPQKHPAHRRPPSSAFTIAEQRARKRRRKIRQASQRRNRAQ